MVDAPNWGQDWQFVMRDNAASVFATDPQRNTIFSIHMYGVFDTAAEITDYLGRFVTAGLPIVVGEFGFDHSDGNPDEDTILATAQARGHRLPRLVVERQRRRRRIPGPGHQLQRAPR